MAPKSVAKRPASFKFSSDPKRPAACDGRAPMASSASEQQPPDELSAEQTDAAVAIGGPDVSFPYRGIGSLSWCRTKLLQDHTRLGGPCDLGDFGKWPEDLVKQIFKNPPSSVLASETHQDRMHRDGRVIRFQNLYNNGLVVHSFFSGKLTDLAMIRAVGSIMHKERLMPDLSEWLVAWCACDSNRAAQCIATHREKGPMYVFGEILSILPEPARETIKMHRPPPSVSIESKIQSYQDMKVVIEKGKKRWFKPGALVQCVKTGGVAPLAWQQDRDKQLRYRPLTAVFGGFNCTPFSSAGGRLGCAHADTESYLLFAAMVDVMDWDLFHLENSDNFPIQQGYADFQSKGGSSKWMRHIFLSPEVRLAQT